MSMSSQPTLAHLNLDVRDLDAAEQFYRDTLQLPVERSDATSLTVRSPTFLLVLTPGPPAMGGQFHFGFRVDARSDVDAWFERLRSTGVPILEEPVDRGRVYVGRIRDPDGYTIEIYAERS